MLFSIKILSVTWDSCHSCSTVKMQVPMKIWNIHDFSKSYLTRGRGASLVRSLSLCLWHFRTFFLKNRYLSDYVVPACPKYISGKLRSFSKNFSKNCFHTTLFENFLPNGVSVAAAKKSACPGAGNTQKSPMTQKIDFFKVRDIDTPIQPRKKKHQSNFSSALKTF